MATYFYDLPATAKRRNVYVHPSAKAGDLRIFGLPDLIEANGLKSSPGAFVYPGECRMGLRVSRGRSADAGMVAGSERVPLTTYVVADLDNEEGMRFVKEALMSMVILALEVTFLVLTLSPRSRRRLRNLSAASLLSTILLPPLPEPNPTQARLAPSHSSSSRTSSPKSRLNVFSPL